MSRAQSLPSPLPWGSTTDVKNLGASPSLAADTVARIFGARAASIAAWCALYARQDGDEPSYALWLAAFKQLKTSDPELKS